MAMERDSNNTINALLKTLKNGKGMQHIINGAYGILGNPFVVFDTSYRLLAYSQNTVEDDPIWNELVSLGTFSHETVNFFREELFIDEVAYTDRISVLRSSKLKYDRINSKIFDESGIHIANICIVACYKPFFPGDFKLIEKICEIIAIELQSSEFYLKIEHIFRETFITKLVDGEAPNTPLGTNELTELDKKLKSNLYVATVDITQYDHTLIHIGYFRDIFKNLQNEYEYYIYLNNIVVIISVEQTLNIDRDLKDLHNFFKENNIFAGISGVFYNLLELQKYYRQAIHALNYGMEDCKNQNIFKYDDYRIDHLISTIKDKIERNDICDPIISEMLDYDRENHTSQLDILYNYLFHGRNIQLTSEYLKMDINELREQLEFIEETFSIDWNNGNRLFGVYLSMKFLRQ